MGFEAFKLSLCEDRVGLPSRLPCSVARTIALANSAAPAYQVALLLELPTAH